MTANRYGFHFPNENVLEMGMVVAAQLCKYIIKH